LTKIHLLIDDDYIETFMMTLPKNHVTVIEEDFENNKELLNKEFNSYKNNKNKYLPYYESMKSIDSWLNKKGS
jgi:hypothetical protein